MRRAATGELEAAVMDVLWDSESWLTPGEVHEQLSGDRALAYNTVLTILVRLWNKGRLERRRDGRAFAYRPTASREQWAAARIGEVLGEVSDRPAVLSQIVKGLSKADRAELRRLLAARAQGRRR